MTTLLYLDYMLFSVDEHDETNESGFIVYNKRALFPF